MQQPIEHQLLHAEIHNYKCWIKLTDPETLKGVFNGLLATADFNVLNFSEHFFPVQGYTSIWLLAESHLAIHTFPNKGWSYIELSSCNAEKAILFKQELLQLPYALQGEASEISTSTPE